VLPLVEDELLTCACPAEKFSRRTPDLALVLLSFVEILTVTIKWSFCFCFFSNLQEPGFFFLVILFFFFNLRG